MLLPSVLLLRPPLLLPGPKTPVLMIASMLDRSPALLLLLPPPLLRVRGTGPMPPALPFMPVSAATSIIGLLLLPSPGCVAASAPLLLGAPLLGRLGRPLNDRRPPLKDRRPLKDARSLLRPCLGLRGAVVGAWGLLGGVRALEAPRILVLLNRPVLVAWPLLLPLARARGDMMSPRDLRELHAGTAEAGGISTCRRRQHKHKHAM
jgi:hypothetical protein